MSSTIEQCIALLRDAIKQPGAWGKFEAAGFHVTPVHFYQPIPDLRMIKPEAFTRASELPGVDMDEAGQAALFTTLAQKWHGEFAAFPAKPVDPQRPGYHTDNGFFNYMDGLLLYSLLRERKPRRIVEVGSGFSTLLIAAALARNRAEGHETRFESYDPYPREGVGLTELAHVAFQPLLAQQIPLEVFTSLGAGDFLFIDSSHVVTIGSDVHRLALEVYPRLARGVWLHVHDIFLPHDYSENWVMVLRRFWNEQYLLQAFLQCNRSFAVRWGARFMNARRAELLAAHIPGFGQGAKSAGGSFWMERVE